MATRHLYPFKDVLSWASPGIQPRTETLDQPTGSYYRADNIPGKQLSFRSALFFHEYQCSIAKTLMMELTIRNNLSTHQFETVVEGHTALIAYTLYPGGIAFMHTEVPEALEGRGIAGQLAKYVLEYARENHLKVKPYCPYVNAYMKRLPEYNDLL